MLYRLHSTTDDTKSNGDSKWSKSTRHWFTHSLYGWLIRYSIHSRRTQTNSLHDSHTIFHDIMTSLPPSISPFPTPQILSIDSHTLTTTSHVHLINDIQVDCLSCCLLEALFKPHNAVRWYPFPLSIQYPLFGVGRYAITVTWTLHTPLDHRCNHSYSSTHHVIHGTQHCSLTLQCLYCNQGTHELEFNVMNQQL